VKKIISDRFKISSIYSILIQIKKNMSKRRTGSLLKLIAIIIVLLAVAMHLQMIIIPALVGYNFWLVVLAFGLMLLASWW
jgi:hypothetical protein